MKRIFKILYFLSLTLVFTNASPKFGERIKKDDKNTSLIEVFRPQPSSTESKPVIESKNQIKSDSKQQNINNDNHFDVEPQIHDLFSTFGQNNGNTNSELGSNRQDFKHRSGLVHQPNNKQPKRHQTVHPFSAPDFSSFGFNFPDVSSSDRINGPPLPPPPPEAPHQAMPGFGRFQHPGHNYESHGHRQSFQDLEPNHGLDSEFSFNAPKEFKHNPRADFKKELMGAENNDGKPWGTKMSYTYRDPKNPNNFMEMSEVRMSVNREMDPQEAQSQVQKFLMAAQSGQYGRVSPVHTHDQQFDQHPNHNYDSEASHFPSNEPLEPKEPKFPNF